MNKKIVLTGLLTGIFLTILYCIVIQPAGYENTDLVNVTIKIDTGESISTNTIGIYRDSTALQAFRRVAELETIEYPIGMYVKSVNSLTERDDKYWMFYVNDALAPVGVSSYRIENDCTIEFRYEVPTEFLNN